MGQTLRLFRKASVRRTTQICCWIAAATFCWLGVATTPLCLLGCRSHSYSSHTVTLCTASLPCMPQLAQDTTWSCRGLRWGQKCIGVLGSIHTYVWWQECARCTSVFALVMATSGSAASLYIVTTLLMPGVVLVVPLRLGPCNAGHSNQVTVTSCWQHTLAAELYAAQ